MYTPEFRTVFAGVRPARVAVLIDHDDADWQETCRRLIEYFASTWGGRHSMIVPTDGSQIDAVFWDLLEAFDPDYICVYYRTGLDWKIAAPERYQDWLQSQARREADDEAPTEGLLEELDRALSNAPFQTSGISNSLKRELKTRLAPFFFEDGIVEHTFSARSEPDYPLTAVSVILPHCEHPAKLCLTDGEIEGIPPLWVESVLGATYEQQEERIRACGVTIERVALGFPDVRRLMSAQVADSQGKPPDYVASSPFEFSMAALSQYGSVREQSWQMPVVVVVGLTLRDFALYSIFRESEDLSPGSCPLGWTRSRKRHCRSKMAWELFLPRGNMLEILRGPFSGQRLGKN